MSAEEEEILRRQITDLQVRILKEEESIQNKFGAIANFIRLLAEGPPYEEKTLAPLRRMLIEYGETPRLGLETIQAKGVMSYLRRSIGSERGWISRWKKIITELEKLVPPYRFKRIELTFSISTGTGHDKPFLAEVTAETIIGKDETIDYERIVNVGIKYFWIIFDSFKDVTLDCNVLWGEELYTKMLKWTIWLQKYARVLEESEMDKYFKALERLGGLQKPRDEYATRQAIIKVGESEYYTETTTPAYPRVDLMVEKVKPSHYKKGITVIVAPATTFDMLYKLGIVVER